MADEPMSLSGCFAEAESNRRSLDLAHDTNSDHYQERLASTIAKYQQCVRIAEQISLFSRNEAIDDISTADLQFLLLHFHIAELLLRQTRGNRKTTLQQSREEIEQYLNSVDSYDGLSPNDTKIYERYRERPDQFSTASTTDLAARRQTKIDRFKEEKALKEKLAYLRRNPEAIHNDETLARNLYLTSITISTHQAFQMLESIAQELQILAMAPPTPPNEQHPNQSDTRDRHDGRPRDNYSERLDPPISQLLANGKAGPILDRNGRPIRPFTLLDSRQRLQDGVFRPDHSLPTMTIDEYLEEEKRRGGIIEGGGPQSGIKPQIDEDDMDIADAETMKARAWDDYKDENPRGAGNTMNMG